MRMFQIPVNDERIQSLTEEQLDFMLWSHILDDPEKVKKLDNYFYDPDFDKEFDELMQGEDISETDFYKEEKIDSAEIDDWEEV